MVKAISLPHDVPNASDRRLIELENQVQRLMEAHLSPKPSVQVNKIASSCEICCGPHDTQYCMKNPEQAFVDYASSRTDKARASNWLKHLPAGSITTWEDLTTHFLAQFFPPGRIAKLRNDILMFQQHQGEYLSEAWTRFKDLLQKVPHHGIDLWL
ncbi:MAK10-like protein [Tanacetum coccineum]